METPNDIDALLSGILSNKGEVVETVLDREDEEFLRKMLGMIRKGHKAVLIVETEEDKLKYMFSHASRLRAIAMMARVSQRSAEMLEGDD